MKVSVIIPCFNGQNFISDAINSVLSQTHEDLECIVVDDASADGSPALIQAMSERDPRVVPLLLSENGGPSAARNKAIAAATGEWIAPLDADDLYVPDRLETLLTLAETSGADVVFDNQFICNAGETKPLFKAFDFLDNRPQPIAFTQEEFFRTSMPGGFINSGYLKPMFRKSFLEAHDISYDEDLRLGEDFLFFAELLSAGAKAYATDYCGYTYFIYPNSLVRSGESKLRNLAELSDTVMQRAKAPYSPESVATLKHRKNLFLRYVHWIEFKRSLTGLKPLNALKVLVGAPDLLLVGKAVFMRQLQKRGLLSS